MDEKDNNRRGAIEGKGEGDPEAQELARRERELAKRGSAVASREAEQDEEETAKAKREKDAAKKGKAAKARQDQEQKEERPKGKERRHEEQSLQEVLNELDADPKQGLNTQEAKSRIGKYGPNTIEEEEQSALRKFAGHFWGPIPWMLEAAMVLSAVVRHWEDFAVIGGLLILNGFVGFWQEHKVADIIEKLKQQLAPETEVLRDGEWSTIAAKDLVPGDVAKVKMGAVVPADVRLVDGPQRPSAKVRMFRVRPFSIATVPASNACCDMQWKERSRR